MIGKRFAILICVAATGLMALGAPGPAAAKKKHPANPWAGTWTGMTEATTSGPPAPISFRITKRGMVIGLTTTVITFDRGWRLPGAHAGHGEHASCEDDQPGPRQTKKVL